MLEYFGENLVDATVYSKTLTVTNGVTSESYSTAGTDYSVLFWRGSAAQAFVDERFKDKTTAAISMPSTATIKKGDKVVVDGTSYNALSPDDVGNQGEHILVALGVYS